MTIKGIGTQSSTAYINRINSKLSDLHIQLASGKKAQTYGMLGNDRNIALKMRSDIKNYEGYNDAIKRANIHLGSVQNILGALSSIEQNARADFNGTAMALHDGSFTNVKIGAEQRLNDAISLMNEEINGRYVFAGSKLDTKPVETVTNIINGVGAKAGLKQYISERKQADLGALDNGRLVVANAGAAISVTEDGVHDFGLKFNNITQNVTGLTSSGPTGSPQALGFDFTGAAPVAGQEITINVKLPDGENIDITLTAKADGSNDKEGFVIGTTDAENATNFEAALNAAIGFVAKGEMAAASAATAADGFFGEPPMRIAGVGPTFEGATAMVAGTDADTLSWYNGDKTPGGARSSYKIFASKNSSLEVGTRADEEPMRNFMRNMALMVAEDFDPNSAESNAHYGALKQRVATGLSDNNTKTGLLDLSTELGYKEKHLENLSVRNSSRVNLSLNILSDVEEADTYEVSAQLLALNTQLEMSYKATSILDRVHLINFI